MNKKLFKNCFYLLLFLFTVFLVSCGASEKNPVYYTITMMVDGSEYVTQFQEGDKFELECPDSGYVLIDWYKDSAYTELVTEETVTQNMTVYAKTVMKGEEYKITYNLNGGAFMSSHKNKYTVGETYTLTIPVKEPLYTFLGWKLNGEFITEISDTMYGDITLDANWNDDAKYYHIDYVLGDGKVKTELLSILRESDTYQLPDAIPNTEECFYGWYLEPTFETRIKKLDKTIGKDITLYAQYGPRNAEHTYISFLGDSITTYQGYIPSGYAVYYPRHDVLSVGDTWWYSLTDKLGYNLLMNNAFSGSKVGGTSESACINASRLAYLVTEDKKPDIVVVFMGSNDWAAATIANLEQDKITFKANYETMLKGIYDLCGKDVSIYLCSLPANNYPGGYQTLRNGFNEIIYAIAKEKDLPLIDFNKVITSENVDLCTPDPTVHNCHPNKYGMTLLANCAYDTISKIENEKYNEKINK